MKSNAVHPDFGVHAEGDDNEEEKALIVPSMNPGDNVQQFNRTPVAEPDRKEVGKNLCQG